MKLSDIFYQLTVGELSQLNLGGGDFGEIDIDNYERVLAHVNLGLTKIYSRFALKRNIVNLLVQPEHTSYVLSSFYALSNTETQGTKYIDDSVMQPFRDNVLKVEAVYYNGIEYAVDLDNTNSVLFYGSKYIKIPSFIKDGFVEIHYLEGHSPIKGVNGIIEPEKIEVDLPEIFLEPLLYFVAARITTPMGMLQTSPEGGGGNNYYAKFEKACKDLEIVNGALDRHYYNTRLHARGFV